MDRERLDELPVGVDKEASLFFAETEGKYYTRAPQAHASYTRDKYCKCPENLNTKVSEKTTYANSADPDQTAPEGAV